MTAWLLEVIDVLGALAFAVSIILFLVGLLIRYGKNEESFTSSAIDLLRQLEDNEVQDKIGLVVNLNGKDVFVTDFPIQIKKMYFRLEDRYQLMSQKYDKLKEAYQIYSSSCYCYDGRLLDILANSFQNIKKEEKCHPLILGKFIFSKISFVPCQGLSPVHCLLA